MKYFVIFATFRNGDSGSSNIRLCSVSIIRLCSVSIISVSVDKRHMCSIYLVPNQQQAGVWYLECTADLGDMGLKLGELILSAGC